MSNNLSRSLLKLKRTIKKDSKSAVLVSGSLLIGAGMLWAPFAQADSYDAKIRRLQQENAANSSAQASLEDSETTLVGKVKALQARIAAIQSQIAQTKSKRTRILRDIAIKQNELKTQQRVLGSNIREMYFDDQMSNLEKLASSRDLSHYVDKEQYSIVVQNKIQTTMQRIEELKKQLEEQKKSVESLLKDQKAMQKDVARQKAEQDRLLGLNRSQQAAYEKEISGNNARIAELRRQQAAENSRGTIGSVSYGGTGSYPWANVPFPNSMPDPWGMYKRQCVSYTAWRVASSGRHMPYWGGRGNANLWDDNARAAGIPVDYKPRVGDVAVSNAGYYGHVMYVESVHGDGTITVSDYNRGWDGRYSKYRRSTSGLVFIHF